MQTLQSAPIGVCCLLPSALLLLLLLALLLELSVYAQLSVSS